MAVGKPEYSMDSWGIRYVKKKVSFDAQGRATSPKIEATQRDQTRSNVRSGVRAFDKPKETKPNPTKPKPTKDQKPTKPKPTKPNHQTEQNQNQQQNRNNETKQKPTNQALNSSPNKTKTIKPAETNQTNQQSIRIKRVNIYYRRRSMCELEHWNTIILYY